MNTNLGIVAAVKRAVENEPDVECCGDFYRLFVDSNSLMALFDNSIVTQDAKELRQARQRLMCRGPFDTVADTYGGV